MEACLPPHRGLERDDIGVRRPGADGPGVAEGPAVRLVAAVGLRQRVPRVSGARGGRRLRYSAAIRVVRIDERDLLVAVPIGPEHEARRDDGEGDRSVVEVRLHAVIADARSEPRQGCRQEVAAVFELLLVVPGRILARHRGVEAEQVELDVGSFAPETNPGMLELAPEQAKAVFVVEFEAVDGSIPARGRAQVVVGEVEAEGAAATEGMDRLDRRADACGIGRLDARITEIELAQDAAREATLGSEDASRAAS